MPSHSLTAEGIIAPLRDMLRFTNGLTNASTMLLPRLDRCYLAENRAAAQSLAVQHPEMIFLVPDGVSYQGHAVSGGKKLASGPLALKRELRELNGQVQTRQREMDRPRVCWKELRSRSPD